MRVYTYFHYKTVIKDNQMYINDDNNFFILNIFLHVAHLFTRYKILKKSFAASIVMNQSFFNINKRSAIQEFYITQFKY